MWRARPGAHRGRTLVRSIPLRRGTVRQAQTPTVPPGAHGLGTRSARMPAGSQTPPRGCFGFLFLGLKLESGPVCWRDTKHQASGAASTDSVDITATLRAPVPAEAVGPGPAGCAPLLLAAARDRLWAEAAPDLLECNYLRAASSAFLVWRAF